MVLEHVAKFFMNRAYKSTDSGDVVSLFSDLFCAYYKSPLKGQTSEEPINTEFIEEQLLELLDDENGIQDPLLLFDCMMMAFEGCSDPEVAKLARSFCLEVNFGLVCMLDH